MKKELTATELQTLKTFLNNNDKIKAIKYLRNVTGLGLKECKDTIDAYAHNPNTINDFRYEEPKEEDIKDTVQKKQVNTNPFNGKLTQEDVSNINLYLKKRNKLQAIKLVKNKLQTSLKDAKNIVENYAYNPAKISEYIEETSFNKAKNKNEDPIFLKQDKEIITFEKMNKREKKRRKSNSGCMLTLSIIIIVGIVITKGIIHLFV